MENLQQEITNLREEIDTNKTAMTTLYKQADYLVDTFDKLTERFNAMGKFMAESNKAIMSKLEDSGGKLNFPRYALKPTSSELTGELAAAMSKAKKAFGSIDKGGTSNRGNFSSIPDMVAVTAPVLEEHQIDASFLLGQNEHGEYTLTLRVTHSSNQWMETTLLLHDESFKNIEFPKNVGAAEKHFRRYMFRAMFNLAETD